MAKMKATPKTYADAIEVLRGRDSVRLGNNTYLERCDGFVGVRLHGTYVVRFHENGAVTLHTGGYHTSTTKDRINEFITGSVYQKNFEWFYVQQMGNGCHPIEFSEGMNISAQL